MGLTCGPGALGHHAAAPAALLRWAAAARRAAASPAAAGAAAAAAGAAPRAPAARALARAWRPASPGAAWHHGLLAPRGLHASAAAAAAGGAAAGAPPPPAPDPTGADPTGGDPTDPTDAELAAEHPALDPAGHAVVNFYALVPLADPAAELEAHRAFLSARDVRGRVYLSPQGVNAQCGGGTRDAVAYARWVAARPPFACLRWSADPAPGGHAFPKLRLKLRPNLVSLAGGMAAVPVTDPAARAAPVDPERWAAMLAAARAGGRGAPVLLDVRNAYEWDAGHFEGAARPDEEEFAETPVAAGGGGGAPEGHESDDGGGEGSAGGAGGGVPAPLRGADPATPVLMYCTGGIRCDVYSAYLKSRGFTNLYTLEGGVQAYLKERGAEGWRGSLFVFDARMAVAPARGAVAPAAEAPAAVPCQVCGAAPATLPHANCANVDCNALFVACAACRGRLRGCCGEACLDAPRLLRPPLPAERGQYGNWAATVEAAGGDAAAAAARIAAGRGDGRASRRRRRLAALRERQRAEGEERRAARRAAKAAFLAKQLEGVKEGGAEGGGSGEERLARLRELRQRLTAAAAAAGR